jgi:molecular chaperone DnaJ
MYAEIVVETPVNLTKEQKKLLEQFEAEGKKGASHSPESDSFFQRVKEFFGKEES